MYFEFANPASLELDAFATSYSCRQQQVLTTIMAVSNDHLEDQTMSSSTQSAESGPAVLPKSIPYLDTVDSSTRKRVHFRSDGLVQYYEDQNNGNKPWTEEDKRRVWYSVEEIQSFRTQALIKTKDILMDYPWVKRSLELVFDVICRVSSSPLFKIQGDEEAFDLLSPSSGLSYSSLSLALSQYRELLIQVYREKDELVGLEQYFLLRKVTDAKRIHESNFLRQRYASVEELRSCCNETSLLLRLFGLELAKAHAAALHEKH